MRTGSPRNALVARDRRGEFTWFALADSVPLLSMNAGTAARRILRAAHRGRRELILTPAAVIAVRLHGIAPATTLALLAGVERLLPTPDPDTGPTPAHRLGPMPRWFRALTTLTGRAAADTHEHDDLTPTPDRGHA